MQSYNKILRSLILNICIHFIFNNYQYINIYLYRIPKLHSKSCYELYYELFANYTTGYYF